MNWTVVEGGDQSIDIEWPQSLVNWPLIEGWGGLTASQFRGWAVGHFSLQVNGWYLISCVGVSEFYIDDQLMRGDVYGIGYGVSSVYLLSGRYLFYVPFSGMESTSFQCSIEDSPQAPSPIIEIPDHLVPDLIVYSGQTNVAGEWFGLSILNTQHSLPYDFSVVSSEFTILEVRAGYFAAGQSGIVNIRVASNSTKGSALCAPNVLTSTATFILSAKTIASTPISVTMSCIKWQDPFAFTFLDVDNSVQYAAARAPSEPCPQQGCPVLFSFHGAGVDARKNAWVYAYEQQRASWILLPTNRRQFGFDWEGPGRTNAWYALQALASQLPGVPSTFKSQFRANPYLLQYAGHSMGGHGCWYISTHSPDRALSVSPAAGWIKMGMYIPFFTRVGDSLVDPHLQSILMSSIAMHNSDFYMRNLKGIPLMVRMGADDDNVPPYHLKRMARLHNQIAANPTLTNVSEIPGEGHWWGGVVDDPIMQSFFNLYWSRSLPKLPDSFTISIMSPADFESRGGIQPLQLFLSGRAGYISVSNTRNTTWTLRTSNIRRFRLIELDDSLQKPTRILVDGFSFTVSALSGLHLCKSGTSYEAYASTWVTCPNTGVYEYEKNRELLGPIPRILEGPIIIVIGTRETAYIAAYREAALILANALYYSIKDDTRQPFLTTFFSPRTSTRTLMPILSCLEIPTQTLILTRSVRMHHGQ